MVKSLTMQQAAIMELAAPRPDADQIEAHVVPGAVAATGRAQRQRIYLAGFDVFRRDALAHGDRLRTLCELNGFDAIYPLDRAVPPALSAAACAQWIYRANLEAIDAADIVMANLNDFRGPGEPDAGTAFEIGYAVARRKAVWAYTDDASALVDRVPGVDEAMGRICERGYLVEDFGLHHNLMIACSTHVVAGGPQGCLAAIAASVATGEPLSA